MARGSAGAYLSEWKTRHGLTDARAAEWCQLSASAFRRQRRGEVTDRRCRQTVRLAELYPLLNVGWLDVAETATKVARLIGGEPKIPAIRPFSSRTLTKS